jgi:MFS family permease
VAVAAALLIVWLLVDPHTPDLSAAEYRLSLFDHLGLAVWDEHWYAGHNLPGYSLLFPPLADLLGVRLLATLSALASTALFACLTLDLYGRSSARWAAVAFAVAAVADVWIGRLAFALGVSFALAAVLAFERGRLLLAGVFAVMCAAASPVAGALLALAGLTHALARRSPRALLALAAPAVVVVVLLTLLFPEGGSEPYPILSFAATLLVVVAFVWALPPEQPLLRLGAGVYLLVCVACLLVPTAMGSNIERYAVLLAGPLLVSVLLSSRGTDLGAITLQTPGGRSGDGRAEDVRSRGYRVVGPAAVIALCAWAVWVGWGPVRETLAVSGNQSTSASYYVPVERFLATHGGALARVEVPLTRAHWENALLAPKVSLARGWEKQLDSRFNHVLLAPGLNAETYLRWLREQAVRYIALPDTPLDPSSSREGKLIRAGLPYLREVFSSRHWRIYEVRSPTPLALGPGRLTALGHDSFALHAYSVGSFLLRVHYSRYLTVNEGSACVRSAPGGWTSVLARAPGTIVVQARFSLSRAFGLTGSCRSGGGG